jgi:outer membrane murein-binding lipoprotein Lpp
MSIPNHTTNTEEKSMKLPVKPFLLALCVAGGLVLTSCSSSPSEEEMQKLNELKSQASQLEGKLAGMQRDKASLEKQIAEKNGKLQQCQSDQEAVKKAMAK